MFHIADTSNLAGGQAAARAGHDVETRIVRLEQLQIVPANGWN
jgi:hypothetical protein